MKGRLERFPFYLLQDAAMGSGRTFGRYILSEGYVSGSASSFVKRTDWRFWALGSSKLSILMRQVVVLLT